MESCLKDILNLLKPLETDRAQRLNVIDELSSILRSQISLKGTFSLSNKQCNLATQRHC